MIYFVIVSRVQIDGVHRHSKVSGWRTSNFGLCHRWGIARWKYPNRTISKLELQRRRKLRFDNQRLQNAGTIEISNHTKHCFRHLDICNLEDYCFKYFVLLLSYCYLHICTFFDEVWIIPKKMSTFTHALHFVCKQRLINLSTTYFST